MVKFATLATLLGLLGLPALASRETMPAEGDNACARLVIYMAKGGQLTVAGSDGANVGNPQVEGLISTCNANAKMCGKTKAVLGNAAPPGLLCRQVALKGLARHCAALLINAMCLWNGEEAGEVDHSGGAVDPPAITFCPDCKK